MKFYSRSLITLLLIFFVSVPGHASVRINLSKEISRCASMVDSKRRLECYDGIAKVVSIANRQSQSSKYIQPSASFLESRLVEEKWKSEFKLTVKAFVKSISQAVMKNKKHVTVQGWSRENGDYVLHITMKNPVNLYFKPRDTARGEAPMTLLRDVSMDGYTISAWQFIITISSMFPDEETINPK